MKGRVSRQFTALFSAAAAFILIHAGCAGNRPVTGSASFIIFGNTKPESPFRGFTDSLETVIASIMDNRPEIIIHTGNAVYGGTDSDGILARDVERQDRIFFSMLGRIPAAVYTLPGDSDAHNGSLDIYLKYSGRSPYYSFNYGSIHFILLDTDSGIDNLVDQKQMNWLKEDLEKAGEFTTIFVITHHPVHVEEKIKGKTIIRNNALLELFIKYGVRAVFSGRDEKYSTSYYGGVDYYVTGCGGYTDRKENKKKYQYYMVTFVQGEVKVSPQHVNIEQE